MDILTEDGHALSQSFKHEMTRSPSFRGSIHTKDVSKVRTMLKIFGATNPSLAKLQSCLHDYQERMVKDAEVLSIMCYVMHLPAYNFILPPPTLPSITNEDVDVDIRDHWIWTIKNIGAEARLDLLLAYGSRPTPHDRKRLL